MSGVDAVNAANAHRGMGWRKPELRLATCLLRRSHCFPDQRAAPNTIPPGAPCRRAAAPKCPIGGSANSWAGTSVIYTWCEPRLRCSGKLSGCFVLPGHSRTLPTLRKKFLGLAKAHGCEDLDASAIRHAKREITQPISAWIYPLKGPDGELVSGVQYLSRHGDDFTLWALYERETKHTSPPQISDHASHQRITPEDPDLAEAMRIHEIKWEDE